MLKYLLLVLIAVGMSSVASPVVPVVDLDTYCTMPSNYHTSTCKTHLRFASAREAKEDIAEFDRKVTEQKMSANLIKEGIAAYADRVAVQNMMAADIENLAKNPFADPKPVKTSILDLKIRFVDDTAVYFDLDDAVLICGTEITTRNQQCVKLDYK